MQRRLSITSQINGLPTLPYSPFSSEPRAPFFGIMPQKSSGELPIFIKPLPAKIGPDEIAYLEKKGALTVPRGNLRSEMLRAYVEFVHPYMPLLDLHDFLSMIDRRDGSKGKVSLILFQAVMFAGSAFVDMEHLRAAGYGTRKEARKDFFQKTRVSQTHFLGCLGSQCIGRFGRPTSIIRAFPDTPIFYAHVNVVNYWDVRGPKLLDCVLIL
jgi:hypothetical protein